MQSEVGIVGGGLTGAMMALALSHSSDKISLVIQSPLSPKNTENDKRTTTINSAGKKMLDVLGVWEHLSIPPVPIHKIMVAEGVASNAKLKMQKKDFNLSWHEQEQPMAFVVDNSALFNALCKSLAKRPVKVIESPNVAGIDVTGGKSKLLGAEINSPQFDLVVACDGANSRLRDSTKLKKLRLPHTQTAIVGNLILEQNHLNTAFQRFLPGGPIALMPSGDHLASLVWTMQKKHADEILETTDDQFNEACNNAFGAELGALKVIGKRQAWQLQPTWMPKLGIDGLLFAGDAGHNLHPLAGQGYNLALADAAVLADCLTKSSRLGLLASHPSVRQSYQWGRQIEITAMTTFTNGLNYFMSYGSKRLVKAAGIGMSIINASPFKNVFNNVARGGVLSRANLLSGKLPT